MARIKAVLRRGRTEVGAQRLTFGNLNIDLDRMQVLQDDKELTLASQEWGLLQAFVENQGMVLSRQQLLDLAWGVDWVGDPRTVDVHVRQLRRKLGDELPLATIRGVGYRLD